MTNECSTTTSAPGALRLSAVARGSVLLVGGLLGDLPVDQLGVGAGGVGVDGGEEHGGLLDHEYDARRMFPMNILVRASRMKTISAVPWAVMHE